MMDKQITTKNDQKDQASKSGTTGGACLKRSLRSAKDFANFRQMLEDALQAEVKRRSKLAQSEPIATNQAKDLLGLSSQLQMEQQLPQQPSHIAPSKSAQLATSTKRDFAYSFNSNDTNSDISVKLAKIQSDLDQTKTIGEKPILKEKPKAMYKETTKKAQKQSILRKIGHLLPQCLLDKTGVCQHEHGCFENIVRKALKNFLVGFCIQMILKNLLLIAKPAKLLKNL